MKTKTHRKMIVYMKGHPEYKLWLESFAEWCRMPVSKVIDRAIANDAARRGFRPPPNR